MGKSNRIQIAPKHAAMMIYRYISRKLSDQARAAGFIVLYLFGFQMLIIGTPLTDTLRIIGGVVFVVLGLAMFLEGLFIGLMPLGEKVGLQLPKYSRIFLTIAFGLLIGFVSTLAEPAVNTLRTAGSYTNAWEAPLLFMLLEVRLNLLIAAVGIGVSIAVSLSMVRFFYGLPLKPFVLSAAPVVLVLSLLFSFHDNLKNIIGLAWDTGAVTTGPVTVPLILALGLGISRSAGKQDRAAGGFGSIALASLFPVFAVLLLGLGLSSASPGPMEEQDFFSPRNRDAALSVFAAEEDLKQHAFTHGSSEARSAFFDDEQAHRSAVQSLAADASILGEMHLSTWINQRASQQEKELLHLSPGEQRKSPLPETAGRVLQEEAGASLRAVLPLTALLLFALLVFLKDRPKYTDEFILGILLALVGMTVLTSGIRMGLVPLGDTVGRELPSLYQADHHTETITVDQFDPSVVFETIDTDGTIHRFFFLEEEKSLQAVPFREQKFNEAARQYTFTRTESSRFRTQLTGFGVFLVLLFAFGLGYGSTLAEPALNTLGTTVEETTVGTIKRKAVIRAVSVGVGAGLTAGVLRILFAFPVIWILIPAYVLLLLLTLWCSEEYVGFSWDSGGVTTGPITVPLVLSLGLGIGGSLGTTDSFGILALASVFPILSVQFYGAMVQTRQRRRMRMAEQEADYE